MRRSIDDILNEDKQLAQLQAEVARLQTATRTIREHLDPVISDHCTVVKCNSNELVLMVDSSVWAGRVRYLLPQLAGLFSQADGRTPRASIKVAPVRRTTAPTPRKPLSDAARATLAGTAEHIDDERLKRVLLRIAARRSSEDT